MTNKVLIALLLTIPIISYAQKSTSDFEQKLDDFRYSLYQDMEDFSGSQILNSFDSLYINSPISNKVKKFITENEEDIYIHKQNILADHKGNYTLDENKYDLLESPTNSTIYQGALNRAYWPYTILLATDPFAIANSIVNSYVNRWGWEEAGAYSLKKSVAKDRIVTKKLSDNKWQVIYDNYRFVFYFEYNLEDEYYEVLHIYKLKDNK